MNYTTPLFKNALKQKVHVPVFSDVPGGYAHNYASERPLVRNAKQQLTLNQTTTRKLARSEMSTDGFSIQKDTLFVGVFHFPLKKTYLTLPYQIIKRRFQVWVNDF